MNGIVRARYQRGARPKQPTIWRRHMNTEYEINLTDVRLDEVTGGGGHQDKLGNFQIQALMSDFNEAQTLASSILKKRDDAGNAVIQKI
jgi:hypothetical protein